jgi:hypothetical protein
MQFLETRQLMAQLLRDMAVVTSGVLLVQLSATDAADFFTPNGLGKTGKKYVGWAIANGSNGTTDYTTLVPAGTTPVVKLASPTQVG